MSKLRDPMAAIWLAVVTVLGSAWPVTAGPAINQFETKDLDSSPGDLQFQSQNALSFGNPRRQIRQTAPGAFAFDDNTIAKERFALEMQMGITSWFRTRLGVEFEKERVNDPSSTARAGAFEDLHLTGIAMEGVFVFVPVKGDGVGLGLLTEFDHGVRGGGDQFYIGPIIQAVSGPWTGLANLLIVQHSGSPDKSRNLPDDRKRDFAYAAQLQYTASPTWALAVEAYGTLDRIGHSGSPTAEQALFGDLDQHRIGPVVYYRFDVGKPHAPKGPGKSAVKGLAHDDDDPKAALKDGDDDKTTSVSVGLGLLFGLNRTTPDETLKLSLEVNF